MFLCDLQETDVVEGTKFVMDDMSAEGNPDYLTISASIDKSALEPVANVVVDLKKDVVDILVKVTLSADVAGEFKEIYKAKDFNPCKDEVEDVRKNKKRWISDVKKRIIVNFLFVLTGFSQIRVGSN